MGLRLSRTSVSYAKPNPHCRVGCHRKTGGGYPEYTKLMESMGRHMSNRYSDLWKRQKWKQLRRNLFRLQKRCGLF
ncbi:MAG: hypothetical protein F6K56_13030 [Moorea sp. SIO3G5]|nr:hypothetical protein [Moorena sp. SIO3G5]